MVDTIGPMVRSDENKARRVELAHVAGGTLGGATTGFVLGAAGALIALDRRAATWALAALASIAAVLIVVDWIHEGRKLGLARQTPRSWGHVLPRPTAAFLNGFDLGLGWSTRIYFGSYAVAMAAAVLSAHALAGAAVGASFGGARALFVVLAQRGSQGVLSIDFLAPRRRIFRVLDAAALLQFTLVGALTAAATA